VIIIIGSVRQTTDLWMLRHSSGSAHGFQSTRTQDNSYFANSYPSQLVPNTKSYPEWYAYQAGWVREDVSGDSEDGEDDELSCVIGERAGDCLTGHEARGDQWEFVP